MNIHQNIDIYCERTDATFWSEPINALTNLSFIIAAYLSYRLWKRQKSKHYDILALIILAALVGIGSFLFHSFATKWAMLADIIPIIIFMHLACAVILYRVFALGLFMSIGGVFIFALFTGLIRSMAPMHILNGSLQYGSALLLLVAVTVVLSINKRPHKEFLLAILAFVAALTFRSLDMLLCDVIPLGVHFMWHLLNGGLLYLVITGTIKQTAKPEIQS